MEKELQPELTTNEIRGIDLIVKALKKRYDFITGWEPVDDYRKYHNTLFIAIKMDMEKVSDYFGFRIRPTIKKLMLDKDPYWYGRDISNPTLFLDLPEGNEDGYKVRVQMKELASHLYQQLPEQLQRTYIYQFYGTEPENVPVALNINEFLAYI